MTDWGIAGEGIDFGVISSVAFANFFDFAGNATVHFVLCRGSPPNSTASVIVSELPRLNRCVS